MALVVVGCMCMGVCMRRCRSWRGGDVNRRRRRRREEESRDLRRSKITKRGEYVGAGEVPHGEEYGRSEKDAFARHASEKIFCKIGKDVNIERWL
jgi:hypothetical protein